VRVRVIESTGSCRTDLSGALILTSPGRQKEGSLRLIARNVSQNHGMSSADDDGKYIRSPDAGLGLSHIGGALDLTAIQLRAPIPKK
jgi:hypothetical protein